MFIRVSTILLCIFVALISWSLAAQPSVQQLEKINSLPHSGSYQKIILSLPEEQYVGDKRYIALDPNIKQVDIIASDIRYDEEAESFARHRRHYVAFWTLFLFMFGVDILWAE